MQPGRQRESHRPPSPQGMGNTNNNTFPITITASPPITANPSNTQNAVHTGQNTHQSAVHIVQKNSCSLLPDKNSKCATSSDGKETEEEDVFMQDEHKSPRQGTQAANAAAPSRNVPVAATDRSPTVTAAGNILQNEQRVSDRIHTPIHHVMETYANTPPFPKTAYAHTHDEDDGKSSKGNFELKWITLRADLRSPSSPFYRMALPKGPSNNKTVLGNIMYKAATMTGQVFSPNVLIAGLDTKRIKMETISNKERDEQKKKHEEAATTMAQTTAKTAAMQASGNAAGGIGSSSWNSSSSPFALLSSSSSSSPTPPSNSFFPIHSHHFQLYFDTVENCKKGFNLLTAMGLSPRLPTTRIITGKVYGFPFTASNDEIEKHLQQHAWYEGGCPSLVITRAMQPKVHMHGGMSQPRDECYFSVLASESTKARAIPSLKSLRPLTYHVYRRSEKTVCYHCNRVGHTSKQCDAANVMNACDGVRDACIMCGSFDHVSMTCPSRDDPHAKCIICHQAKHSVRACPLYRGTYKELKSVDINNKTQTQSAWSKPLHIQTSASNQHQQQPQPHPQIQHKKQRDTTIEDMIKMMKQIVADNTELRATVNSLTTQLNTLVQTISSLMAAQLSNNNSGMIMYDGNIHDKNTQAGGNANMQAPITTPARKSKDTATGTTDIRTAMSKAASTINKTRAVPSATPHVPHPTVSTHHDMTEQDEEDDDNDTNDDALSDIDVGLSEDEKALQKLASKVQDGKGVLGKRDAKGKSSPKKGKTNKKARK